MMKQYSVRDTSGNVAFYLCELTSGILRISDGKGQPIFIDREELAGIIIETYADARARKKKNEALLQHQKAEGSKS